jgi:hypothetical protein
MEEAPEAGLAAGSEVARVAEPVEGLAEAKAEG